MKYITGDLLDVFDAGGVDALLHVANCQGIFGSGIALQIKNRYPEAYKAYRKYHETHRLTLGTISGCKIGEEYDAKYIYNLHAQLFYGREKRHLDYEALYVCLDKVRDSLKGGVIGIPYLMGADRAGGSWSIVDAMLKDVFKPSHFDITVVEYK